MAKKKKPVKRELSAGGAVFKEEKGKTLWLIVQPKRDDPEKPIHWRLAKGIIEKGESTEATALREVEEETGVKAEILAKIGKTTYFYNFRDQKIFKIIIFFLMEFQTDTGNGVDGVEIAEEAWLPFKEAYKELTFDSEKKILKKAKELLEEKKKQLKLI
jgi:8-oxo-dGTP pyrophosphatase MutT (NUDIX family)